MAYAGAFKVISIHAPAKGATAPGLPVSMRSRNFNPRSREGSDCRSGRGRSRAAAFQSTLPRRERRYRRCMALRRSSDFNPRSREGATCAPFMPLRRGKDFNPRSREGSDLCSRTRSNALTNFNPRSREGSDTRHLSRMRHAEHFNPRSREGSDVVSIAQEQTPYLFQSTLPRRERPEKIKSVTFPKGIFNPRSREGERHER